VAPAKFKPSIDPYWFVAIFFIAIKLLLHFLTNGNYELHRDEMLYFNMGAHLSFGYVTVPPFIGFLAFLVKSIFGYSVFGIRLFPALAGAASLYLIAKIILELKGGILALVIASTAFVLSGGFLIFDTIFTPNAFEQLFWLLLVYLFLKMVNRQNPFMWLPIGLVAGFSFLDKYSIVFFILAFLIALMLSPHRQLLRSKYLMFGAVLSLFIVSPNILWQYNHGWPVVHHMNELKKTQLVNMNYSSFAEDLFSLGYVYSFLWLFGLIALLAFKTESKYRFFGVACLTIFLFFLLSHGKAYYTLGILPFLFAYGGYAMEKYFLGKLARINYLFLTIAVIFSLLAMPFGLPLLKFETLNRYHDKVGNLVAYPFSRWEDGKKHNISQVYSDMTGWNELAAHVARGYNSLNANDQKNATIYGLRNYGYAGAINFYGSKYQLPDAITFLDSYVLWAPDSIPDGPLIYINTGKDDVTDLFLDVKRVGEVQDPFFREKGLQVFLCKNPKANICEIYKKKAAEEKNVYQ
jgi:hypothetical protein